MQTLTVGLLLAGVSATTLVAFKHPLGYAKLFPYLIGMVTTVFVCVVVWHVAVEMTWRGLEQYIGPDFSSNAKNAIEGLSLIYYWVGFWFWRCSVFFGSISNSHDSCR